MRAVVDDTLSVQQAADLCGATYRTIYRMVQRGELPAWEPGEVEAQVEVDFTTAADRAKSRRHYS